MRKLAPMAVVLVLAVWPLEPAVTGGADPLVFAAPRSTSPTVKQTVAPLDPDTSEYTVAFTIPVDANTDMTDARVELSQGDSYHGQCICEYQRSSGAGNCAGFGDFPATASAKYTRNSAVVTCTFTIPPRGLYQAYLQLFIDDYDPYTGGQIWRFPGIYGEGGYCMGETCPTGS